MVKKSNLVGRFNMM